MIWLVLNASSSYDQGASIGAKVHPYFWPAVLLVVLLFIVPWALRRRKSRRQ